MTHAQSGIQRGANAGAVPVSETIEWSFLSSKIELTKAVETGAKGLFFSSFFQFRQDCSLQSTIGGEPIDQKNVGMDGSFILGAHSRSCPACLEQCDQRQVERLLQRHFILDDVQRC
jgi:hypothetical protein